MEGQRVSIAFSNGFCRILFFYGLVLLLTPQNLFSNNYSVMFDLAAKEDWAVLYLLAGSFGWVSLYVGSWKVFRHSIAFAAFAFTLLASILLAGALSADGTFAGFVIYANLAVDCVLYLAGAPIYGPLSESNLKCKRPSRRTLASSNIFSRILLSYGLVLLLTPQGRFNAVYAVMFDRAPKWAWAALSLAAGSFGFTTLYAKSWSGYRIATWSALALFLVFSAFFLSSNGSLGGVVLFVNLAIDCLLYLQGAPIYGFVSKQNSDDCGV